MVARGLAESREKAQALIMAGAVMAGGQKAIKPGQSVAGDLAIEVTERPPYVSRGGVKLAAALDEFGISVAGLVCLDIGASTGGFTDCLLQRGAVRVHAIDVGTNQLDWRIRSDARVHAREQLNARELTFADMGELVDLLVCDVSFISVTLTVAGGSGAVETRGARGHPGETAVRSGQGAGGQGRHRAGSGDSRAGLPEGGRRHARFGF